MKRVLECWAQCDCCGGDIPPEPQWRKRGERSDGYCPGRQRSDGMCGAFAERTKYRQVQP